jgi:hypothetical protein
MTAAPEHENGVNFWEYEVASATSFTPNLKRWLKMERVLGDGRQEKQGFLVCEDDD